MPGFRIQPIAGALGQRQLASAAGLLHELFEARARLQPGASAVLCDGKYLSYGELESRANQFAHFLRTHGIQRGDRVGLLLPRSADIYVALLAVLKAGAAYVPLDCEYPVERVQFILSDCKAKALVTVSALKPPGFQGRTVELDAHKTRINIQSDKPLSRQETGARPEDLCYVIYTSGTTGTPKGVEIEHRSAVHLVHTEGELFQVSQQDRVYQGFSIAFDASVEEVWLAFFAGATLVAATAETVRAGLELCGFLKKQEVTVLSCVPTVLAMMEEDVPSIRLLILGGETCPPDLVRRWWKPTRRLVNTYGPTEATVIATYADCEPSRPVTIGKPLPGYTACILDEEARLVPSGTAGELCLGGIGLARGYLGRPELTAEKFITFAQPDKPPQRLYRTGDLARFTPDGDLEFLGRIDTQVKIRGFRVELSEIESVLMEFREVKAAAVTVREEILGIQQLIGYVVLRSKASFAEGDLKSHLRKRLPAYMVPAVFEVLAELPLLPSGKVDRKQLPAPNQERVAKKTSKAPPGTELERTLVEEWEKLFAPLPVSIKDDFFRELGGHSLLAARMVSELRRTPPFDQLSMADIYNFPTIELLAAELEDRTGEVREEQPTQARAKVPFWRHFLCGTAQLFSLVFVLSFSALQWLTPYLVYTVLIEEDFDFAYALVAAFASLIVFYPVMVLVPVFVKWIVIGRYRPGNYPLWGSYYFRWWLVTTIEAAVPINYLSGTPLLPLYLRLMGAKVGHNVHLSSDSFAIYDLLTIGDDSSINSDATLLGYTVENGYLKIGSIALGERCFVGVRAAVREDTVMEDDAALEDLSLLPRGSIIPSGEVWRGSPATPLEQSETAEEHAHAGLGDVSNQTPRQLRVLFGILHGLGLLVFPVLVSVALFPGIVVMNKLNYIDPYYWYLFLSPLVGLSFIVLLALEIAGLKWLLLGRVEPGKHPLLSLYYLRKWFVDQTMLLSLDVLGPLYASIYLAPWYSLLGAKLGRGAEVSTASFISPDLLTIGEESFVADSVSLGAPRVRNGIVTLGRNELGKRSFVGNSALLPPGTILGNNMLIGCLSTPPENKADALKEDSAWLGSPAMFLPQRQKNAQFGEEMTYDPPSRLRALRATIEFVRVITPSTCFIILLSLLFSVLLLLHDNFTIGQTLLFFPPLYTCCGIAAALFTIVAKWALVWRYRPGEKPLWSTFVWRNELLNALHEHLAEPFLVGALTGTPFVCWYFRLLGAKVGRRVYMETTDFSEFDLARIGDEAALNADCTIQSHLFEDRVMKMSTVDIGPRCYVGAASLVLYDTRMEAGSSLGALSLLMKGEVLRAETTWEGIPAKRSSQQQHRSLSTIPS